MKHFEHKQYCDEWWAIRNGKPTASDFKKIITSKGDISKSHKDYARSLAADLYANKSVDKFAGNAHTERGTELEPEARAWYEFTTDCQVTEVGFMTDDLEQYGASLDGVIGDDGALEIKCLSALKHIQTLEYYDKNNRMPPDYVAQTQGQLFVSGRHWSDLLFYHPELPSLIITVEPIMEIFTGLERGILQTIAERNLVLQMLNNFNKKD